MSRSRARHFALLIAWALLLPACAPKRPVLYPNPTLQRVGQAQAEQDVDRCLALAADSGFASQAAQRTAKSAATAGSVGAAAGAAAGAVRGDPGRRAAAWGAGGAAGGFLRGLFRWRDPDPIQARFVQRCLGEQGYAVIGWR